MRWTFREEMRHLLERSGFEPIAEYNRMEAEKAGRCWAEHIARMARNQADFEARQRDFVNLWAAETVSQFGSQITLLALPLYALVRWYQRRAGRL